MASPGNEKEVRGERNHSSVNDSTAGRTTKYSGLNLRRQLCTRVRLQPTGCCMFPTPTGYSPGAYQPVRSGLQLEQATKPPG